MSNLHPFQLRLLAEDLVRVRRSDDRERYAASQRHARTAQPQLAGEFEALGSEPAAPAAAGEALREAEAEQERLAGDRSWVSGEGALLR